jgi:ubiquinone/menaquinone biosynthesis C-methylase UbiE
MSCLDVGCGGGDVTLKMAALVGAEGNVVGVDRDEAILRLAGQEAERRGLSVTFRRLDAEELTEQSAYDLVFARYLLSHLPRPQRAVEAMVRALRPGGRLVLEDVFFPGHVCYPPAQPSPATWSSTRKSPGRRREGTRRSGRVCWNWRWRPGW